MHTLHSHPPFPVCLLVRLSVCLFVSLFVCLFVLRPTEWKASSRWKEMDRAQPYRFTTRGINNCSPRLTECIPRDCNVNLRKLLSAHKSLVKGTSLFTGSSPF